MSGRIRTVKPEWLEDERMASQNDTARVLSIVLILVADDYGRGRASAAHLASAGWAYELERDDGEHAPEVLRKVSGALRALVEMRFVTLYEVDGQRYFEIRNWEKHQKVSHKGKERVPGPPAAPAAMIPPTSAPSGGSPESLRKVSGDPPASLLPDLRPRPHTSDHDQRAARARDATIVTAPTEHRPGELENRVRSSVAEALRSAGRPAPPLDTSSKCQRIADWCNDHANATGRPVEDVIDTLARGFASAAGKTAKAGWPLGYLAQNPGEYIRLAPSNPMLGGGETDEELLADLRRTA